MVTPLAWMLVTSIETVAETRRFPPVIIPSGIHCAELLVRPTEAPFSRWFVNTMVVTDASR